MDGLILMVLSKKLPNYQFTIRPPNPKPIPRLLTGEELEYKPNI